MNRQMSLCLTHLSFIKSISQYFISYVGIPKQFQMTIKSKLGIFLALAGKDTWNEEPMKMADCGAHLFLFQQHTPLCVDFRYSPLSYIICSMVCSHNSS